MKKSPVVGSGRSVYLFWGRWAHKYLFVGFWGKMLIRITSIHLGTVGMATVKKKDHPEEVLFAS